jgi:hypothetical protein
LGKREDKLIDKIKVMKEFSPITQERIGSYVYMLVDPRDNKIFYVGEGQGNRVFDHEQEAIESPKESDKLNQIREIHNDGLKVKKYIVRHGLHKNKTMSGKDVAFEIESTLIDLLTYTNFQQIDVLSNIVAGHHSFDRGIKTVDEIEALYDCKPIEYFAHRVMTININKTYSVNPNIYEATRKSWKIDGRKAKSVEYVLSEYQDIVRAIFRPADWYEVENGRWEFIGEEVTDKTIVDMYLNHEVPEKKKGMANPIRYFGMENK